MSESEAKSTFDAEPDKYFQSGQWWSAKQGDWIGKIILIVRVKLCYKNIASCAFSKTYIYIMLIVFRI